MHKLILLFVMASLISATRISEEKKPVSAGPDIPADVSALLSKYNCVSCHAMERKLVGPMWKDIAAKKYTPKRIAQLVAKPEPANWPGYPPMVAQKVAKADMNKIAAWITSIK